MNLDGYAAAIKAQGFATIGNVYDESECEAIIKAIERAEINCEVGKGGVMVMSPLLLHSSSRTTNNQQRRVIHLEFSRSTLPSPLNWAEAQKIPGIKNPMNN